MALSTVLISPALGVSRFSADSTIAFPVLTKNASLAVRMVCSDTGKYAEDLRVSFVVTNTGSTLVSMPGQEIWTRISLRIYDESGKLIRVNGERFEAGAYPIGSIEIPAGKSVQMRDRVVDDPSGTHFPLSHFGYYHLPSGTYKLVADATDPARPGLSDNCTVSFRG
jgi:hypothetical protein